MIYEQHFSVFIRVVSCDPRGPLQLNPAQPIMRRLAGSSQAGPGGRHQPAACSAVFTADSVIILTGSAPLIRLLCGGSLFLSVCVSWQGFSCLIDSL